MTSLVGKCVKHGVVIQVWGNPAYMPKRCYFETDHGDFCRRLLTIEERDDAESVAD